MVGETNWKECYLSGQARWDTGRRDFNLVKMVKKTPIRPCRMLEVGCGTGTNALWLEKQGFSVTAVDVTAMAIERAKIKANKARLKCRFFVADFLKQKIKGRPFNFIFDRGCFHHFESAKERAKFAKNVALHLKDKAIWLSLIGSKDQARQIPGPPLRSVKEIALAVEPHFEILSLYSSWFDSDMPLRPKCWVCLMRKRKLLDNPLR
ncbi:MAG: methyltransferase type 11 [Candidatus Omnitrophica bacterium CG11_big_fil_rev_8_21_14_0_20_42_13]|uniref:Methyltransferase type 11 n=1 Tax=Candidatus Ghiorseimicrobium undicola TaxID=1974746 RepID=A0A2H0LV38_9BACT|nr:MAG: methyltransferase type 11 [Candidatus Omnitrophica bacterium CG11_big_fil_rev_8_21_14_0_20_42_13]